MTAVVAPRRTVGFWLWQLLPPLAMLVLLATGNGASFFFMTAMLLPVAIVSLLSLAWKLIRRREPARLLRPALALLLVVGAWVYAQMSLASAHAVVDAEARRLQALCGGAGCPEASAFAVPKGSSYGRAPAPPTHLHWSVAYRRGDAGFELELLHGPDFATLWTGGPGQPVQVFDVADHTRTPRDPAAAGATR